MINKQYHQNNPKRQKNPTLSIQPDTLFITSTFKPQDIESNIIQPDIAHTISRY